MNDISNTESGGFSRGTQIVLLISLLFLGAGNGLFLWTSVRLKNMEVIEGKRIATEFQTSNEAKIKDLLSNLITYSRNNPEFNAVLARYPQLPTPNATPAAAAPAAAPKKP
jgi:hypothetical protein